MSDENVKRIPKSPPSTQRRKRRLRRLWDPSKQFPKPDSSSSSESTSPPKKKDRKVEESSSGETSRSVRPKTTTKQKSPKSSSSSGSESSSGSGYDTIDEEFKVKLKEVKKKSFDLSHSESKSKEEDINHLKTMGLNITAELLGKGGFGEVYSGYYGKRAKALTDIKGCKLRNVETGTKFAAKYIFLKFSGFQSLDDKDFRDRYETENQINKFANHPNIVSIRFVIHMGPTKQQTMDESSHKYSSGERVWFIMDYADQGNLEDCIEQWNIRSYQQCFDFAKQLCSGLHYLHNNRIIHGDIKGENVLLFTEDNKTVVKWCDFGLGTMFSIQPMNEDHFDDYVSDELRNFTQLLKRMFDKCKEVKAQSQSDSGSESNEPQGSDTGESTSMGATGGPESERSESESDDSETDESSARGPSFGALIPSGGATGGQGGQYVDPISNELDRIHKLESEAKRRLKELIKELESGKNLDEINTRLQIID